MFTYGLLFIIANGLYLLFSILVGVSIYFLLRKKWWIDRLNFLNPFMRWKGLISTTAFLVVLLAPFYDLIIQMGIKTYYQNFKMNDTIYAYPEKDENGKIESLNNISTFSYRNGFLIFDESYKTFLNSFSKISDFVEIKLLITRGQDGKYIGEHGEKLIRFNLKDTEHSYAEITKNDFKARYLVEASIYTPQLFELYNKKIFKFQDKKEEKLLATAWRIEFPTNRNNFRNKFLFWRSANGMPIGVDFISNDKAISEKVFGFDYRINVSKLRG